MLIFVMPDKLRYTDFFKIKNQKKKKKKKKIKNFISSGKVYNEKLVGIIYY